MLSKYGSLFIRFQKSKQIAKVISIVIVIGRKVILIVIVIADQEIQVIVIVIEEYIKLS